MRVIKVFFFGNRLPSHIVASACLSSRRSGGDTTHLTNMARSACSLLVLAGTVFSTAITGVAAAAARRGAPNDANWKDAIPTATAADADVGDRWTHLRVSHRPTNAPKLVDLRRDVNAKRTHFGANTCGFFPDNDGRAHVAGPRHANSRRC